MRIENAILVQNLTKKYGDIEVLRGVNLEIEEGEFYALMGPNGSGKTTLTSIIASVRLPTSGRVEIYGKPPERAKELVAYIPQENFSSTLLTGRENLMYFAGLLGYSGGEAKKTVDEILGKLNSARMLTRGFLHILVECVKGLRLGQRFFPQLKFSF